jgi:hypothetical protein
LIQTLGFLELSKTAAATKSTSPPATTGHALFKAALTGRRILIAKKGNMGFTRQGQEFQ